MTTIRIERKNVKAQRIERKLKMDRCEVGKCSSKGNREPSTAQIMKSNRGTTYTYQR